jgi:drug/metabolite transporter (DMT)-like permease
VTELAVAFALLSACTVAFSTSLQHQAAELAPGSVTGVWGLLRHLVQRPLWVVGQLLGVLAFVFHALALRHGPIALVQPVVVSGIVLAVLVRAAMARQLPGAGEIGAVVLAAAGLAVFLAVSAPSAGRTSAVGLLALSAVLLCLAVAAVAMAGAQRIVNPTRRACLLGAGAGILFALVAVLLKLSLTTYADSGLSGMLATWPPYLLVVAGLGGVLCNQVAYRTARLSSSMPVLNVVDCLLALFFGYVVLGEVPRHSPGALVAEVLALASMLTGLWVLARDVGAAVGGELAKTDGPLIPAHRAGEPLADPEPTHSPRP